MPNLRLKSLFVSASGVVLWLLVAGGCRPASPAVSPVPAAAVHTSPSAAAPTATLLPTMTAAQTVTPTPGPELDAWQFYGGYLPAAGGVPCRQDLPPGGFILGAENTPCGPGTMGGGAQTKVHLPALAAPQVLTLRVVCATGSSCADAVMAIAPGGGLTLTVDSQVLWSAQCDASGQCDRLALGEAPTAAFVSDGASVHTVELAVSPNVFWPVARLEVAWQPVPQLIRGVAYSPFRDCQNPNWGPFPMLAQIKEDLNQVRHMGNAIRTYSSLDVQGQIPILANQVGLRVSAGAWLGPDKAANEKEIAAVIKLAQTTPLESVIVGNEVLLRGDLTEDELLGFIARVKQAVKVPVTTAEIGGILLLHPRVVAAVDYELVHLYAFWEGVPIENAARHVADQYHQIQQTSGKRVVIGETGWPSQGPVNGSAVPSAENERRFLDEFLSVAQQENIEFYYFATFDELWKTEGGVGAHWGLFYPDRRNKYDITSVLISRHDTPGSLAPITPQPTGTAGPFKATDSLWPIYTNYAAPDNHFAPGGWMGDLGAIHFNDCAASGADWQKRIIEVRYTPALTDTAGWAGIYWLQPDHNWGTMPGGYDLTQYAQLRFRARSLTAGARVKFFVGGVFTGTYPSSIHTPLYAQGADAQGFVKLSTQWQDYHIDLRGADLSHVIDGFGWAADHQHTPEGVTLDLDAIVFDSQPPSTAATRPAVATLLPAATPPTAAAPPNRPLAVYAGPALSPGFDMGVDTSQHVYDWVTDNKGSLCMAYPPGQSWGVVFVTVGKPAPSGQRLSRDLSTYKTLSVELQGAQGGEVVSVGLKDARQPDDGSESKIGVTLTQGWQTYDFPLSAFAGADLTQVYIPAEFVFEAGVIPETVCFRNIWFLK